MNRTQRRQAERKERRGIVYSERIVPLPALLDEFTVFDMPQSIIDQLTNGTIDAADDVPVFRDNRGEWCEVVPALEGWLFTWKKINSALDLDLHFDAMELLASRLGKNLWLNPPHIEMAAKELQSCRYAFRTADRKEISRIAKTAQIQILME